MLLNPLVLVIDESYSHSKELEVERRLLGLGPPASADRAWILGANLSAKEQPHASDTGGKHLGLVRLAEHSQWQPFWQTGHHFLFLW